MEPKNTHFYYSFLNAEEKKLFNSVCLQLCRKQPEIRIPAALPSTKKIILSVLKDCPEFYYVDNTRIQFVSGTDGTEIRMRYTKNLEEIRMIDQRLEQISSRFLSEIYRRRLNCRETVRYVHDFILRNTEYDYESAEKEELSGDVSNICGVFCNQRAVCKGISLAAKWLLDRVEIPSGLMEGRVPEEKYHTASEPPDRQNNHAWNIVKINHCWSYMDVTMDMGAGQKDSTCISYDYFLRSEANMSKYLQFDSPGVFCDREMYSYYVQNKVIFAREEVLLKFIHYCKQKRIRRLYFQVEGGLAMRPPDEIRRMISRCIFSGYQWRYNPHLKIYDFELL